MTKNKFIEKVLNNALNSLFVDPQQVDRAIELFEALGMLPPISDDRMGHFDGIKQVMNFCKWDEEEDV